MYKEENRIQAVQKVLEYVSYKESGVSVEKKTKNIDDNKYTSIRERKKCEEYKEENQS